ncbi:hypothetical protein BCV70DRAFT_200377 [Testicularia cyperi]|uniref:DUF7721 domain-containing protein n=1 Tax=Testicularia cyperi TaxID=1882483 RepID=A0A317XPK6_9BASI|nr:hypothetical protein BCV70DRAFT_200377 [Testicularia cyperi]
MGTTSSTHTHTLYSICTPQSVGIRSPSSEFPFGHSTNVATRILCTQSHTLRDNNSKMFGGNDNNQGGGFNIGSLANMAQDFANSQGGNNNNNNNNNNDDDNNNNNRQQNQGGDFNIGQLSSLAQNFSSGNHDSSLFSAATSFLQNQGGQGGNVNEQELLKDHDDVNNQSGSNSAGQIGNAAVISALKSFIGGGGNSNSSSGGSLQDKIVSMAMSHAADLYDQKDSQGQAQGNKQDAVNQAGQMAMKLAMKNPAMLAGLVGGGNSGGLGSLLSMLNK